MIFFLFSSCVFKVLTMCALTFQDLNPYLSSVMPGLKQALLDPVPEVSHQLTHSLFAGYFRSRVLIHPQLSTAI